MSNYTPVTGMEPNSEGSPKWKAFKGPWNDEPDRLEFRRKDYACLARRNMVLGHWCGYVGLPPRHPLYDKDLERGEDCPQVHGGITYQARCNEEAEICHAPKPGEPEALYWLGFDMGHARDLTPAMLEFPHHAELLGKYEVYRDLEYVRKEIVKLADWAAAREDGKVVHAGGYVR